MLWSEGRRQSLQRPATSSAVGGFALGAAVH
jgi:hypothetical protein